MTICAECKYVRHGTGFLFFRLHCSKDASRHAISGEWVWPVECHEKRGSYNPTTDCPDYEPAATSGETEESD